MACFAWMSSGSSRPEVFQQERSNAHADAAHARDLPHGIGDAVVDHQVPDMIENGHAVAAAVAAASFSSARRDPSATRGAPEGATSGGSRWVDFLDGARLVLASSACADQFVGVGRVRVERRAGGEGGGPDEDWRFFVLARGASAHSWEKMLSPPAWHRFPGLYHHRWAEGRPATSLTFPTQTSGQRSRRRWRNMKRRLRSGAAQSPEAGACASPHIWTVMRCVRSEHEICACAAAAPRK